MTQENPELIAGRYQLVERIGQGGMGRVWRGIDRQLFGREVAIKEILFPPGLEDGDRGTLLRRFTGEARAAVTLSHPGIITVHDIVEHNGAPVIVMEFIRGQSLAAAIREQGRLPVRRVAEIGSAVLDALAEAHEARIVHRDIKPDNVLLSKDRVVLTDFGIAHLADVTTKLSHSGMVIGTPQYMPPEQLEGKRPTPANDLWALGATLYHAVEGRPPFDAEGLHALAIAVFTRPHRPPTQAGPLAPVLDALLTKDPARRANAAEAAALLESVLRGAGAGASTVGAVPPRPVRAPAPVSAPEPVPAPVPVPEAMTEAGPAPAESEPKPEPESEPVVPTPTAEDLGSLGGVEHGGSGGSGEAAAARRGALTRRSTVLAVALATLAVAGVLTWTLSGDGSPDGKGGTTGGSAASSVTVVIGVDAPLSGDLSVFGVGIKNSADLAVRNANRTRHVPGVNFEIKALNDQAQPGKGQENATRFIADDKVLGVVGPLNSSVAQAMLRPFEGANLVSVSPANTNPALTYGADWVKGVKSRPYKTYFRTVATDADQGPFAARYLHDEAKKTKLFVIDDNSAYGTGLTTGFRSEFTRLGGTLVGADHVDPTGSDFATLAARVRASGADAVYFGGYYTTAAPLSKQLKQAGADIPFMGGDGVFDTQFISTNDKAEGDLATGIGAPAEDLPGGPAFLSQYQAAAYPEQAGSYGAYAYDATWAVIEAVKGLAAANGGTLPPDARAKMPKAVAGLAFDGVTGRVAFDQYGDTTNRAYTVHAVTGGVWKSLKSGRYTP
ncbi:bifunctional serine/threonine-protein kinase/ABC transporter substrate-binding protein [Streptomyces goshikiensis]|uniref:bifunctional serine/threonine-protein kinase/ABC transporter substrate-binding protein n=1 Tax=Streptomyces goshikiensis TaxID=1942 RepID=UPI0036523D10